MDFKPKTRSTDVYGSDGSAIVKQEPQNDYPQMESSGEVINIAPIINSQTEICKIEDIHSITQEPHYKPYNLSETAHQPAVEAENDFNVCDSNEDSKLFDGDMSVKTENIQTDDTSSQLMEVSGAIDYKDDTSSNVTAGICVGGVNQTDDSSSPRLEVSGAIDCKDDIISSGTVGMNQTDEEQSDAVQCEPFCDLECTDEIKTEGMRFDK